MTDDNTAPAAPVADSELEALRASVQKLEAKNKELKAEKDRAKAAAEEADELRRYKQSREQAELEAQGNYTEARQRLQEQYDRDTGALRARIAELEAKVRDLELITPAASVLASLVHDPDDVFKTGRLRAEQIESSPGGPVVVNGLERIPLADWARSNLPAHYLKAPPARGTGAPSGRSGQPIAGDPDLAFFTKDGFNLTEQARIARIDPARYQQLREAAKGAAR